MVHGEMGRSTTLLNGPLRVVRRAGAQCGAQYINPLISVGKYALKKKEKCLESILQTEPLHEIAPAAMQRV